MEACVYWWLWLERLKIKYQVYFKCTYSLGGEVRSRCGFQCQDLRWYVLGELQVAAWCERHNCFASGWDGTECWFGAEGYKTSRPRRSALKTNARTNTGTSGRPS